MASLRMKTSLQEYLNCPICLEPLKDAKIMICGHSFCKTCIGTVILGAREHHVVDNDFQLRTEYTLECPFCRREQSLKRLSADELGSNFLANDIAEVLADGDRLLPSTYVKCEKHDSNEKKYFCLQCNVPICSDCGMMEHFGHGDRPATMAEIEASYKRKLSRLLDETMSKNTGHSIHGANLKLIKEEGCSVIAKVAESVEEAFDERYMELSRARNNLCESIQDVKDAFCWQLDDAIEVTQAAFDEVNNATEEVRNSLKRARPADLIQSYGGWKKKLKTAWDAECPSLEHAEQELKKVKELSFKRYPVRGELCVGELTQPNEVAISKTTQGDKNKVKGSSRNATNYAGPSTFFVLPLRPTLPK